VVGAKETDLSDCVVRQVRSPNDAAIAQFGELQGEVYYDVGSLIPGRLIARLLGMEGSRRNFLVVAEQDGEVVGGTFFHSLADGRSAFSSFMGIRDKARGRGLARRLHDARFEVLDAATAAPVPGIFIDVVAPERLPPEEAEAERRFGYEPAHRRTVFQALGFRKVDVAYRQPVGGPGGGPLTTLDLLYCPRDAAVTEVPVELVTATLESYWLPWLGEARVRREIARLHSLATGEGFRLLPAAS
jgi:hypothetical protein